MTSQSPNASPIGKPIDRIDGHLKVTGKAKYSSDMNLPNMCYAVVVQSTIASGTISAIDSTEAEKIPGVIAVLSHLNAPRLKKSKDDKNNLAILQDGKIKYAGQNIAVVVADTLEKAMHGADLIKVSYQPSKANTDLKAQAKSIIEQIEKNPQSVRGNLDSGVKKSTVKVEAFYTTPTETHNPMEPFATVAHWEGDKVTVYETTQGVFPSQKSIAEIVNIPKENVRVITHYLGGGFGCKLSVWSHAVIAVLASRHVKRPVKLVLKRTQMYGPVGFRPQTVQKLALGASKDGKLTFIKHIAVNETSMFREFTEYVTEPTQVMYACPNVVTSVKPVDLNIGSPTWMRAPGDASGSFALESAMDELAYSLGIDPIELRLRNYAEKDPESGLPWSSKSLKACYKEGARLFGWDKRNPKIKSMKKGNLLLGMGMASTTHGTYRGDATATAIISEDGSATIKSGTQDIGTGTYTIMAQVASDVLGIPIKSIHIELGDTLLPPTPMSGGSQTAANLSNAVNEVCKALLDKAFDLAVSDAKSPLHGATRKQLSARDGKIVKTDSPQTSETFASLLKRNKLKTLEATAKSGPNKGKEDHAKRSFGAQFAEVLIDPELGRVKVSRMVGVYGAGKILNEKTARSQMLGGLVWGMGMAMFEETLMDPNLHRTVNNDFAEYHIPVHADMPTFKIAFVPEVDTNVNPMGVKGVGELGINGAAAAIANAIYHASGKRIRDLPITLDKLL